MPERFGKVAVFHPGTQHSWQTATALQDLGRLEFYATSIFYQAERWPYRVTRYLPESLARRLDREFRRFEHRPLNAQYVRVAGLFEWGERMAARGGYPRLATRLDQAGNRRFARLLAKEIRSDRPFAMWGYNSSSLESFRSARAAGRGTILDRTIGDWRYYNEVMAPVFESHRGWFAEGHMAMEDYVLRRDDAEYEAADHILCGSDFCARTIAEYSPVPGIAGKLRVLPYCFDETLFGNSPAPVAVPRDGPVKFLFVGQIGMRKGIHHVLEAIAQIPRSDAELTLVGQMHVNRDVFARYADRVTYLPTVPRAEMPGIMQAHHVMVFPSYFEGSALSLIESLASGLALIQTPQAGNGVTPDTGIALARPDTGLTLAAMREMIDDRDRLDHFRAHAQQAAREYTFARYRENIAAFLGSVERWK